MPVTKVKKEKVTLLAPHTHAGEKCKKGDQIDVTVAQKAWLEKRGLINKGEG